MNTYPEVKRYDCTSEDSYHCHGCFTMKEQPRGDYAEWEDYETLQAECEKLRKDVDRYRTLLETMQGEPVGYVSQDFLDGKWSLDHIARYDERQISRTIPVFAKPSQPAEQQHDVARLVWALKQILGWRELRSGQEFPIDRIEDIARNALAAYRKHGGDV
jgi:hypothetical protein